MGVPLLDSLNYNIFDVSNLPLHNSLQTPLEVLGNQRENDRIFSKWVQNIGNIFSQCWNRQSVCIAPVLYTAPEEIVQRTEIEAVQWPVPAPPFFFEWKTVRNDALLKMSFNQIQGQISRVP